VGIAPIEGPVRRAAESMEPLDEAANPAEAGRRIEAAGEAAHGDLRAADMEIPIYSEYFFDKM
jgi:hypothetical protein